MCINTLHKGDTDDDDNNNNQHEGKAIPLQVLTGADGSRSVRLPDFKTIGT
jgi:hypothetical protein